MSFKKTNESFSSIQPYLQISVGLTFTDDIPLIYLQQQVRGDSTNQSEGFDPGSERTLAAWMRHASRTQIRPLAIMDGFQWRKGE